MNTINRKDRSQDVRDKIINVARTLFIKQGYTATTIRQILKETGYTTGSIYHFFPNKESILMHIALIYFKDIVPVIQSLIKNDPDPMIHYTLYIAIQLLAAENNKNMAELNLRAYRSWPISEIICDYSMKRNKVIFEKYNKNMTNEEWYARTLTLNGMIQNCIAERLHNGKLPIQLRLSVIITAALALYSIPSKNVHSIVNRTLEIIKKKKIHFYGLDFSL